MKHEAAEGGRLTAWVIAAAIAVASVLLLGGLVSFLVGGAPSGPMAARNFLGVLARAVGAVHRFDARGLIEGGLLVLLLTPLARLVAGAVQSARRGDWRFVAIGALVACLLLAGILLGTA